jgi:2-C-methyl-D-erythritol 2,4-cyclodiphosphate synthase
VSSLVFLEEIRGMLEKRGAVLENIDASLVAEAPKIGPHIDKMKAVLGKALALPPERVGLKATTNEKMGFLGRGEGIAAMAVACVSLPD